MAGFHLDRRFRLKIERLFLLTLLYASCEAELISAEYVSFLIMKHFILPPAA